MRPLDEDLVLICEFAGITPLPTLQSHLLNDIVFSLLILNVKMITYLRGQESPYVTECRRSRRPRTLAMLVNFSNPCTGVAR